MTVQCPHCRTVQLTPTHPGAVCVACRRPMTAANDPRAPLPPHLRNAPPPPPTAPPVIRAPVALKPKAAATPPPSKPAEPPPPPKEIVQRPPGRGLWLEFGLLAALLLLIGGGGYLAVTFIPAVDLTEKIAKAKDADVFVVPVDSQAEGTITWTDASRRAIRKRGFKVRVDRVLYQTVMARDAQRQPIPADDKPHLQIQLHLRNDSPEPKRYLPWYGNRFPVDGKRRGAILVDDLGREYPEVEFPNVSEVQGVASEKNLGPKEELRDVLIFDFPVDTHARDVTYWRLALPAAATEDTGVLRFEIPRKMLE